MKRLIKYVIIAAFSVIVFWGSEVNSLTAYAWGDSDGGRPAYTIADINNGALGPVGENAITQAGYPGTIVFNSISDSVIGHEFNFVAAREYTGINLGGENIWNANSITVEDGKTYILRLYVHNNNANGADAVAEDVHVSFSIPPESSRKIQVNGFINSSNATPSRYWDYVDFESDIPFHLEYIYGSALLENNGIGAGGLQLSDDIVLAASGGTPIGYDRLDGRIPGCYQYDSYITIKVRAVFDYGFSVENEVRLMGSEDRSFHSTVDATAGDTVEFLITYRNNDEMTHSAVAISDILSSGLEYEPQSATLFDTKNSNGTTIDDFRPNGENAIKIGPYKPGESARVYFRAKVIGDGLDDGRNILLNSAKVQVDHVTLQSHAKVSAYSMEMLKTIATFSIALFAAFVLSKVLFKQLLGAKQT